MPDVDGIELLRHVRGVDAWSNLPVISEHSIMLPMHKTNAFAILLYMSCASHPSPSLCLQSHGRFLAHNAQDSCVHAHMSSCVQ